MSIRDYIKKKKEQIKGNLQLMKEEKLADRERYRVAQSVAREKARQAREKEIIKTAEYKEKIKGEERRKYIKQGGFMGKLRSNMNKQEISTTKRKDVNSRFRNTPSLLSSNRIDMGLSRDIVTGKPLKRRR